MAFFESAGSMPLGIYIASSSQSDAVKAQRNKLDHVMHEQRRELLVG